MEDLGHAHGEKGHGHAQPALVCLPEAGFQPHARKIRPQRERRNQCPLPQHIHAQTFGEDALPPGPGRAVHTARLRPLHAKGQRGETVGDQVDPQKMHRLQQPDAQKCGQKDAGHLAHVGSQQKLDGLADVLVNASAFRHRGGDGGKVIVRQNHVRHVLGHVGSGNAHAHADVRRLHCRGVVHPVAGHCGHAAPLLPGPHDPRLVLGLHAGIHRKLRGSPPQLLIAHGIQGRAGDHLARAAHQPQRAANCGGSIRVITGDHHGADACRPASSHRSRHLRAHRVQHARKAQKHQLVFRCCGR